MTTCPACGEAAVRVSPRTTPDSGPLTLSDFSRHIHDGVSYYHADD